MPNSIQDSVSEAIRLIKAARALSKESPQYEKQYKEIKRKFNALCKPFDNKEVPFLELMKSIDLNLVDIVLELIDDTTLTNEKNENCLHFAMMRGNRISARSQTTLAIVKKIVEKNPELIKQKNHNGETPLWYAANRGLIEVVKYLLEQGAEAEQINNNDMSIESMCAMRHKNSPIQHSLQQLLTEKNQEQKQETAENSHKRTPIYLLYHPDQNKQYLYLHSVLTTITEKLIKEQKLVPAEINIFNTQCATSENVNALYKKYHTDIANFLYDNHTIVFAEMEKKHKNAQNIPRKKFANDFKALIEKAESIDQLETVFKELENRSGHFQYLRSEDTCLATWRHFVEKNAESYDDTGTTNEIYKQLKEQAAKLLTEKNDGIKNFSKYEEILSKRRPTVFTFLAKKLEIPPTHTKLLKPYHHPS